MSGSNHVEVVKIESYRTGLKSEMDAETEWRFVIDAITR